jgi:hypothetical protein
MIISNEFFDEQLDEKGWLVFDSLIDMSIINKMREAIEIDYQHCRNIQIKNGIANNNSHTVHHLVGQSNIWFEYLNVTPIHSFVERYFNGCFILNSFGGAINTAHSESYAHNVHRDIRTYSGNSRLLLNTLVMLDDFTLENGATRMLSGSHKRKDKPSETYFNEHAEIAVGNAGSVLFFDSNVWHSGGNNSTNHVRRSVTPMYSKPFIKPQFDYPRALGYDKGETFSDAMQQILGYKSRIPESLDEWYQPPINIMYRPGQG